MGFCHVTENGRVICSTPEDVRAERGDVYMTMEAALENEPPPGMVMHCPGCCLMMEHLHRAKVFYRSELAELLGIEDRTRLSLRVMSVPDPDDPKKRIVAVEVFLDDKDLDERQTEIFRQWVQGKLGPLLKHGGKA